MASISSDISHVSTRSEPVFSSTEIVARAATPTPQTSVTPGPLPPQPERKPPLPQKPAPAPPQTEQAVAGDQLLHWYLRRWLMVREVCCGCLGFQVLFVLPK
jgi:hypothetical protein